MYNEKKNNATVLVFSAVILVLILLVVFYKSGGGETSENSEAFLAWRKDGVFSHAVPQLRRTICILPG